ncbi:hypothetical protein WJX74_006579 [Apatococcus lobatus]|uniref:RmlD-like substrate binding domain-containing protein n=1 Tax=Apatococcus lobatus TaxID=904363 RepID=A0AAW1QI00_9CHLO
MASDRSPFDREPHVLVTGGSGYLGQFLVQKLQKSYKVGFTHHSSSPPSLGTSKAFWVDLKDGSGLEQCLEAMHPLAAIINTAGITSPAICERHPETARKVHVPFHLLKAVAAYRDKHGKCPLFIQLSTDLVFDGNQAHWTESDACKPINVYGRTKLEAEQLLQAQWPHHVILRSSIIYGPNSPQPVSRRLFLQFVDGALRDGPPTTFFADEWRSPIYVHDICRICEALLQIEAAGQKLATGHQLLHMGGPERLSRLDMARLVALHWHRSSDNILSASAASMTDRGVASPPDVSMDSGLLQRVLGIEVTCFAEALDDMQQEPRVGNAGRNGTQGQASEGDEHRFNSPPERMGVRVLNSRQSARLREVSCDKGHRSGDTSPLTPRDS